MELGGGGGEGELGGGGGEGELAQEANSSFV